MARRGETTRQAVYHEVVVDDGHLLALETSSPAASVALARGGQVLSGLALSGRGRNSAELFQAIEALLAASEIRPQEIRVVALSIGPGSFTGLRVAATLARMLHSTIAARIVSVPTHEVIASQAPAGRDSARTTAVITANGKERLFVSSDSPSQTDHSAIRAIRQISTADLLNWFTDSPRPSVVIGEALTRPEVISVVRAAGVEIADAALWTPTATSVAKRAMIRMARGEYADPASVAPLYVRPPECEEVFDARQAAAREKRSAAAGEAERR